MGLPAPSEISPPGGPSSHGLQLTFDRARAQFIEKVRDVVGLYMAPPEDALVLWVDENSQIQALDRTAPCLPLLPTTPARMTHDYVRPPLGALGAGLDRAILHKVAGATARSLLARIADALARPQEQAVQELDMTRSAVHLPAPEMP